MFCIWSASFWIGISCHIKYVKMELFVAVITCSLFTEVPSTPPEWYEIGSEDTVWSLQLQIEARQGDCAYYMQMLKLATPRNVDMDVDMPVMDYLDDTESVLEVRFVALSLFIFSYPRLLYRHAGVA